MDRRPVIGATNRISAPTDRPPRAGTVAVGLVAAEASMLAGRVDGQMDGDFSTAVLTCRVDDSTTKRL